ncbi:hypothetical protein F5B22DRAFT_258033 [Xylaria bambusicola]|uniref:uncharacterized protein n=1 Tax=Xylaria bambusicola TaxID=326684 RepID=UPI002007EF95|nr:uncharacterized protein F5B22DRAFT_258033 [Xylaria bambusicola]KAI0525885.1 hypothetical protein F5B22DRAFT_258033 [Xylaria bambusicola]
MPPKTKKKGGDPSPNLPSLFPTHDGSYGINTLISPDTNTKKGQKTTTSIAKEQSDDNKWRKTMKSKTGKTYGMNSNLKKAIDESQKQVEEEHGDFVQEGSHISPDENPSNSTHSAGPSSRSRSSRPSSPSLSVPDESPETSDDAEPIPKLKPHIPRFIQAQLPFAEEQDDGSRAPYKPAGPPSDDPYARFSARQTLSPPTEYGPFYGMPQGKGTKEPISPIRPDTSRSFNYESGLFSSATMQNPTMPQNSGQLGGLYDGPSVTPPSPWQSTGFPGAGEASTMPQNPAQTTGISGPQSTMSQIPGQSTGLFGATPSIASLSSPESSQPPEPFIGSGPVNPGISGFMQITPPESNPASSELLGTKSQLGLEMPSNLQAPLTPFSKPPPFPTQQATNWDPPVPQGMMSGSSSLDEEEMPSLSKVVPTTTATRKKTPKQPSGWPQTGNKTTLKSSSTKSGNRNSVNQSQEWIWPSFGFFITPIILFVSLVLVLWLVLSSLPDVDDPSVSRPSFDFAFGTVWQKISNLLPEIPVIDTDAYNKSTSHSSPKPSGSAAINPQDLVAGLKDRMPESIWVRGDKNGKIKISEDFWHALKELIKQDDIILSLKNSDISEDHWRAIQARAQQAGIEVGQSVSDIEGLVEKQMSQAWDKWLKQNDQALKTAETGVALTKDDFLRLFQQEIVSYQREIRQELAELQNRIASITEQLSKLPAEITLAGGTARTEITKIVESLIAKAINNAKLDTVAKGFIKGHANDVLANQVNFFGIGAGVAIDPDSSSSAWKVPESHYLSKAWLDRGGYKPQPPFAALSPWTEEGECFCAGPDRKGFGVGTNNLSMITSRDIIPQHLIVEHILPGATLDPGAMPKEVEIWVYIEEVTLRVVVQQFSERQFPNTPKEEVLSEGFVKIGHFTYENNTFGDGVQVFKISDEISNLGALTNRIVVRAINNYGADHTCFYRLGLYGEIIERPEDPRDDSEKRAGWFSRRRDA